MAIRQLRPVEHACGLPRRHDWGSVRAVVHTQPVGTRGAVVLVLMVLTAVCADLMTPSTVYEINQHVPFAPPSLAHWLGTAEWSYEVFTRISYGARIALCIGFVSALLWATAGTVVGVLRPSLGGNTALLLQQVMDMMLALPLLVLALAIATALGHSMPHLIVAIAIPIIARTARVVHVNALAVKAHVYVEAARTVCSLYLRVMWRSIVLYVMASFLMIVTAQVGSPLLTEASLSCL